MYWIHDQAQKYYRARVAHDLTGQLGVSTEYGSLRTARGRRRFIPTRSHIAADEKMQEVVKAREQHGYRLALDPLEHLLKADARTL